MGKELYHVEQFIAAIKGSGGIITTIAQRVGCQWHTANSYIHRHPLVYKAYLDEQEAILDLAETTLLKSIKAGETTDAKWLLARRGKHRGYGDNVDVTSGGQAITKVIVEYATDKRAESSPSPAPRQTKAD